jgi:DNA-binding IclR family transcriptional regulator
MGEWTFLTNYAVVLSFIAHHPRITARELAHEAGITERAVRKIIKDLEEERYLSKTREGRRVRYSISPKMPLRHRSHGDKMVGDLLTVLGFDKKKTRRKPPR